MKLKGNIFYGKKKNPISMSGFPDLLYFGYLAVVRFLKPVLKDILHSLCFKEAVYVE